MNSHLKDMRKTPAGSMLGDLALDGTLMTTAPTGTGIFHLNDVVSELN